MITGFGRTGKMFGLEHWGVEPDMIQFAKAITSGYFPLGGIGISDAIADVMDAADTPWMHAYTYSAHPVGCAIGVAMLDIVEREGYPEMAAQKGRRLLVHLKDALGDHPHVGDIRGLGLMCAVELVRDRASQGRVRRCGAGRGRVNAATMERGMFSRVRGDVYYLAPPITTTEDQLDRMVDILAGATRAVLG